jgi:hypothetical protein
MLRIRMGRQNSGLTPTISVANHTGLSSRQLKEAQSVVERHAEEIQDAWTRHFGR